MDKDLFEIVRSRFLFQSILSVMGIKTFATPLYYQFSVLLALQQAILWQTCTLAEHNRQLTDPVEVKYRIIILVIPERY